MGTAQKLYESGFITYMRTDSVSLSNEAMENIRHEIEKTYGNEYYQKDFTNQKINLLKKLMRP